MLDLAEIEPVMEEVCEIGQYEFQIIVFYNLICDNPRRLGVVSSIE